MAGENTYPANGGRPVAIVLGGAIAHVGLVAELKRRGYFTIIVDYYEAPPAKPHADEHVRASALDEEFIMELARTRQAALVLCLCLDLPLVTAATVSEALGLPTLIGSRAARLATDKALMKQVMWEAGIPTSRYVTASDTLAAAIGGFRFPVAVKPADSTGSQGVRRANDLDEALTCAGEAAKFSRSGRVIVEEWLPGVEMNVHCMVLDGHPTVLTAARKQHVFAGEAGGDLFVGSVTGVAMPVEQAESLQRLVIGIVKAFGLRNGPLLVQALYHGGQWNVIELAARIGGGMGQHLVGLVSGCDILAASLDLLTGRTVTLSAERAGGAVYGTVILYARGGVFQAITGVEQAIEAGLVRSCHRYLAPGATLPTTLSSKSRVGALIVQAENEEHLARITEKAVSGIDVIDTEGRSIIVRGLHGAAA